MCVDEAHGYKNLRTTSNITDAAIDGSMRASDLDMKIEYLRRRNGRRVVTFATATPIANSVTEAYVMQRYLRPDLLEAAGITVFDAWAATFGQAVTQVELAPEGGDSFRLKSRFARFRNVPEMLRMFHVAADIKTADDLSSPSPPSPHAVTASGLPRRHRSQPSDTYSSTSPSSVSAPTRSEPAPSARRRTTCSRSPATAGAPPSTCASSACPRRRPGRSQSPPSGSPRSGAPTVTKSITP